MPGIVLRIIRDRTMHTPIPFGRIKKTKAKGANDEVVGDWTATPPLSEAAKAGAGDLAGAGAARSELRGQRGMSNGGERLELMISERRIRGRVAALARRIERDYRGRELSLVVVLKGAFVFAADLARQIGIPFTIDFISASSYGSGTRSSGAVTLGGVDRLEVGARDVLVVEDIVDTGRTSVAILDALRRRGAATLGLCTLVRKPAAAALDLQFEYAGFDIRDEFVVGWGMDYAERYRNLRGVYRLVLEDGAG